MKGSCRSLHAAFVEDHNKLASRRESKLAERAEATDATESVDRKSRHADTAALYEVFARACALNSQHLDAAAVDSEYINCWSENFITANDQNVFPSSCCRNSQIAAQDACEMPAINGAS